MNLAICIDDNVTSLFIGFSSMSLTLIAYTHEVLD
jgi:hypothetical protein